ncbi:DUF5667 domain-containing protein [Streptomyces profundus]|uniref:DUF5667 domain-containing protein n=1 Tax=Streptomyces profundus TaxID=2867410 RepID=UPI001D16FA4C|nr:DUF5667 domain-containing protein [Streptomyces sp. MA3_2.13]UED84941.1 DUF5667 domain-containing protein [Streptomyces sp. MA3_2.13]
MIGSVSANRRALAFAQLLEEAHPPEEPRCGEEPRHNEVTPAARPHAGSAQGVEQSALLSVVDRLTALPRPELSAETRADQRAALLTAMNDTRAEGGAEAAQRPALVPQQQRREHAGGLAVGPFGRLRPRSRLSKGLAAGGLAAGVAAGAFGGVAAASGDALPGDTLYGLKRGMEDLRLDFASGDADRGQLYLDHAATRLHEAQQLLTQEPPDGTPDHERLGEVRRALSNMRDDAAEGHRLLTRAYETDGTIGSIQSLSSFFEGQSTTWDEVRRLLPPQLGDVKAEVTDVLDAMQEDIAPLRSLLPPEPEGTALADERSNGSLRPSATADAEPMASPSRALSGPGSAADEAAPDAEAGSASPEPPAESGGLLGGTGLLDTIVPEEQPRTQGPSNTPESTKPQEGDDITIPPLLDDLLPDLGLEVRPDDTGD